MNVVGKVGSLITQGVYSVATPFHPFGGAVDVIVVQQQDGTFRSTPWYVRFGKFQGVLKGAEKVVQINVNGVDANFHMYLDNSGEAYFLREVDDDKGVKSNGVSKDSKNSEFTVEDSGMESDGKHDSFRSLDGTRNFTLDHSLSDTGVLQLKGEGSSVLAQLQRAESDIDRRFYDFQDDPSSFETSPELSEFGSTRYENPDGENIVDSQGSHPEVVLLSVDGHVLTAPISESEQNEDNVQLKTPQFHLGPGEGTGFCDDNVDFSSGENAWAADYFSQLDHSTANVPSSSYNTNGGDNTSGLLLEGPRGEGPVHVSGIKRENVFQSCLELNELTEHDELSPLSKDDLQDIGSLVEVLNSVEEPNANCSAGDVNSQQKIEHSRNSDELSPLSSVDIRSPKLELGLQEDGENVSGEVDTGFGSQSTTNDSEQNDRHIGKSANDGVDDGKVNSVPEEASNESEVIKPQTATSNEGDECQSGLKFDISLCGHELKAGMGLAAAGEVFEAHRISAEEFRSSASSIIKNENLVVKFREKYLSWEKAAPLVLGMAVFGLDLPIEPKDTINVEQDDSLKSRDDDPGSASSGRRWRLWQIPFRKVKTVEHTTSSVSSDEVFVDSDSDFLTSLSEPTHTSNKHESPHMQFVRTNVPTTEQIASLNLKDGQNLVTFSFCTRVLGKQQVDAHIYLWKWNAKIVISDVDGTITKSDVLGQFMPLVGKDWTQSGVARLFSAIKENGYQLLFLSARAIVQAYLTRNFLLNLKQDGKTLPNGPVVISPDGLFPSLFREVIRRAPHEFKIACLEDIKRLFPSEYNPFYAGFGNRDTDELSYRKIGIPKGKIFIINPKGEVAISHRMDAKSYTSLHTLVNDMFPPTNLVEQEDYNSWNYWKMPFPDVE